MEEILNAVQDVPDERDIPYEWLVGSLEYTPVKFPVDKLNIQNQGAQSITRMACSRMGLAHIVNWQTLLTENTQDILWINLWERYLKVNPNAESQWATLLSALDQWVKEKLISSYWVISDINSAKSAIDAWHFIYTWSSNWDWAYVKQYKKYMLRTDWKVVGHCWVIVGYDDTWFTAINSYGQENGYFHVPFELFDSLFTKYAILPIMEISPVLLYKQKLMENITIESAKQAMLNSFWNGERPQDAITREEAAALVQRAYEAIKNWK